MRVLGVTVAGAVLLGLGGCAPTSLYYWGRYEELVYQMYAAPGKADPTTQIAKLTEDIDQANAAGQRVPPGVHAHLGYMHYLQGNVDAARHELETEKQLYPESATFVDGLVQRMAPAGS